MENRNNISLQGNNYDLAPLNVRLYAEQPLETPSVENETLNFMRKLYNNVLQDFEQLKIAAFEHHLGTKLTASLAKECSIVRKQPVFSPYGIGNTVELIREYLIHEGMCIGVAVIEEKYDLNTYAGVMEVRFIPGDLGAEIQLGAKQPTQLNATTINPLSKAERLERAYISYIKECVASKQEETAEGLYNFLLKMIK